MREPRAEAAFETFETSDTGNPPAVDITRYEVIRWPDPSPLQPWWDSIMRGEIIRNTDESGVAQRWLIRCDRCDHRYGTIAANRLDANCAARTNGWIVGDETLCPGCAHVAQARSGAAPAAGAA